MYSLKIKRGTHLLYYLYIPTWNELISKIKCLSRIHPGIKGYYKKIN